MKKIKLLTLILALVLALSLTACGAKENAAEAEGPFAAMETVDLDGNAVDSSVFAENKLTLVNVWNVGCTPCIMEIPHLDQLNRDYADKGVAVMGLYYNFGEALSDQVRQEIDGILTNAGATYPHLEISEAMMAEKELQNIQGFPTTFFVDENGSIIGSEMGARDYEGWSGIVDQLLEKVESNG